MQSGRIHRQGSRVISYVYPAEVAPEMMPNAARAQETEEVTGLHNLVVCFWRRRVPIPLSYFKVGFRE